MDQHDRSRDAGMQPVFFPIMAHAPGEPIRMQPGHPDTSAESDKADALNVALMKGPKRKRLAKACDACHKSKRRCDGTAPCANCYYATKNCTYTDASGRAVPAPRPFKPDRADLPQENRHPFSTSTTSSENWTPPLPPPLNTPPSSYHPYASEPSSSHADYVDDDRSNFRKRFRSDHGDASPPGSITRNSIQSPLIGPDRSVGLDPGLTRELVNLFFTHCHPHRIMFHKPTFSVALTQNHVPTYLLNAMCALAAPLSKQPRIRMNPPRFAGRSFAQEAISLMFDGSGRLVCEPNLATAQALCLLQAHDVITQPSWTPRYHQLALDILERLDVHRHQNPVLTPLPSAEYKHDAVERESVRRVFWLIYLHDLMMTIWFKKSVNKIKKDDLMLRLPADETSFELAVHSTLPEYLYLPAPTTVYASEFGHLIRVLTVYAKIEASVDAVVVDAGPHALKNLNESEQTLNEWTKTLPDHLRLSDENLQVQLSMFETSSNTGAWCFWLMHVFHAACVLALHAGHLRCQRGVQNGPSLALDQLYTVISSLGARAKQSPILGAALWALVKYCGRDDPEIHTWSVENEEIWGVRMEDWVPLEWRSQHQSKPEFRLNSLKISSDNSQRNTELSNNQQQRPMKSPSTYHMLRSFNESRLHNRVPQQPGSNATSDNRHGEREDTRRLITDDDIDPALQSSSNRRNSTVSENPPSLPSLKASGLLDSWGSPNDDVKASGPGSSWPSMGNNMKASGPGSSWPSNPKVSGPGASWPSVAPSSSQPESHHPLRRTPPRPKSPQLSPSLSRVDQHEQTRTSSTTMPVGLQWLAQESSVPRPV